MKKFRRISLYAGPNGGKSTLAAYIYSQLKERHYSVELVTEFVKQWAYQKRAPQSLDQFFILAQQIHSEDTFLANGVMNIITDSPVLLTAIYSKYNGDLDLGTELTHVCRYLDKKYPALNLILERDSSQYIQEGRYHNLEQARELDKIIEHTVRQNCPNDSIFVVPAKNRKEVTMDLVLRYTNAT